jgi:hypothetical protein
MHVSWQIRLLLETRANIDKLVHPRYTQRYEEDIRTAARGHLNWVFTTAERPYRFWHRSYLVNGRPKDHSVFQLDQQCYPLLELSDYLEYIPEDIGHIRDIVHTGVIQEVLAVLESRQDARTGLYATEETPGDDAVDDPFHFSSHVLLWRTFKRLHSLYARLGLQQDELVPRSSRIVSFNTSQLQIP